MSLHTTALRTLPRSDLNALANRMNRIFGDLDYGARWAPPVSVEEQAHEIVLVAELPGMKEDQVEINLENSVLTISGEKKDLRTEGEQSGKFHLVERSFGSFRRSFTLPRTIRAEGITAEFEDGLLIVQLPKADEALSRTIEVTRRS